MQMLYCINIFIVYIMLQDQAHKKGMLQDMGWKHASIICVMFLKVWMANYKMMIYFLVCFVWWFLRWFPSKRT